MGVKQFLCNLNILTSFADGQIRVDVFIKDGHADEYININDVKNQIHDACFLLQHITKVLCWVESWQMSSSQVNQLFLK